MVNEQPRDVRTDGGEERPRGILTSDDRVLLRMSSQERDEAYSRPNLIQRWDNIEERVTNGLEDFHILYHHLPEAKRKKFFQILVEYYPIWAVENLMGESIGFILLGFFEQTAHELDDEEAYEKIFEMAINRALEKVSMGAETVEVEVEIDGWALPEDFPNRELSSLDDALLRSMLNAGEITSEEFAKATLGITDPEDDVDE